MPARRRLEPGAYIFADLERVGPRELAALAPWRDALAPGTGCRGYNHPVHSRRRYDLLKQLKADGINPHEVYDLEECPAPPRFPVFIRLADDHMAACTPLLHDQQAFAEAVRRLPRWDRAARRYLVVEYVDTADAEGLYRKYGAFRIGERIIADHVLFGRNWTVKVSGTLIDERLIREERGYVETNPHQAELMDIFQRAGIDYGRIDYTLLNGRIVVWEINTNPMLVDRPGKISPERLPAYRLFAASAKQAFLALEQAPGPGCILPWTTRAGLGMVQARVRAAKVGRRLRAWVLAGPARGGTSI